MKRTPSPGERLRAWREKHDVTTNAMAVKLGTAWHHVNGYEQGKTPGLAMAVKIEQLTGIPAASWVQEGKS